MLRMGIRELRDNLTSAVRRVREGEAIEVTRDGEPVAILAPVGRTRLDELVARGEARRAKRPLDLESPLHPRGERVLSELLDEQRADRI
jgi:prevent-host-death family protein